MHILILGAAAGGGFPQWNANNAQCQRARAADPMVPPQTQSSVAVSLDGQQWCLFNASPDLRQQINDNPQLHPRADGPVRQSPIRSVVLTNADVDHVAGLLNLRESQPFSLFATARVQATLRANSIFNVLNPDFVTRQETQLDREFSPLPGLTVTAFAVPGKVALYLEDPAAEGFGTMAGDTVGLEVCETASGRRFYYIPGCARVDDALRARLAGAALLLFDGTLFTDEEMIVAGEGIKTGTRMGHIAMSGPEGSLAALADIAVEQKLYIHINNTNPVLMRDSDARRQIVDAGWGIAMDGMEISL
ncbi:MAG TPA: pyrroloquinoline quinone biosynthesis protein PqqB [Alphaproteobacteria bacterium]|nr:pyrroloquinoline quinone biosynthesis protein PqqB [Alphaproteobacteria bacterium]